MASPSDPYGILSSGSGASSGADPYGLLSGSGSSSSKPGGVTGFLDKAVGKVENTASGMAQGVVTSFEHPLRAAQAIGQSYKVAYAPLFEGHFGKFLDQVEHHPLGYALDALSVASLGAGGLAKVGGILEKAGAISEESRLARLGKAADLAVPNYEKTALAKEGKLGGADVVVKPSSVNPLVRARQVATNSALNKLPAHTPVLGSTARATKALMRAPIREGARLGKAGEDFRNSFAKLSPVERMAWHLKARAVTPGEYAGLLTKAGDASPATLQLLENPKLAQLVEQPSKHLQDALTKGRALSDTLTGLKVNAGHVDELTALERPYQWARMVRGATFDTGKEASPAYKAALAERDRIAALHEAALKQDEAWHTQPAKDLRGPMTTEQAQARLAELDQHYQALVEKIVPEVSPYGGKLSRQEQLRRNFENSRLGSSKLPTVKSEEAQLAASKLEALAEAHAGEPWADSLQSLIDERNQLRDALTKRGEAGIFGGEEPSLPRGGPQPELPPLQSPFRNRIVQTSHALEVAQQRLDKLAPPVEGAGLTGVSTSDVVKELDAKGLEHPFYVPDSSYVKGQRNAFSVKPSGFTEPETKARQNLGILASKGLINWKDNALHRDYLRFKSGVQANALHDELVKHAAWLQKGEPLPHGYEYLKLNRGEATAPFTERIGGTHESLFGSGTSEHLFTNDAGEAARGGRLVVPSEVRKIVEDNSRTYHSRIGNLLLHYPTTVWKHLVLGLRPAFFVNISGGNSILGALQSAPGRFGFAGWLNQIAPGAEKVLGSKLTSETMHEVFPEQEMGTFGHSLSEDLSGNKALRVAQRASQGVMPATIGYENVLRRALAEGWSKWTPEIRQSMAENGGDVNAALRSVAKSHPQIIEAISRRIDNALGNYRTYNAFERKIKNFIPFYGWQRHITASAARLISERPALVDALAHEGEYGHSIEQQNFGELPGYLQGLIKIGGVPLSTRSLNPFNSLSEEAALAALPLTKAGGSGAAIDSSALPLGPIPSALLEQLTGKSLLTGGDIKGNALADEARRLSPQVNLFEGGHPKPTSTNQNTQLDNLLKLLGVPVQRTNIAAANAAAAGKRLKSKKASAADPYGLLTS